jgi:hypothetical protein
MKIGAKEFPRMYVVDEELGLGGYILGFSCRRVFCVSHGAVAQWKRSSRPVFLLVRFVALYTGRVVRCECYRGERPERGGSVRSNCSETSME